jgi:predicted MFS family arabinose efflux permease
MYSATPFLIEPISTSYGVSEGTAGAISVVQVGAFAAANFLLPRLARPSGRMLRASALGLLVFNALSAVAGVFAVLVALRLFAGVAAGAMTWLTWTNAMRRRSSMSSVAATGPITALVGAPVLATISGFGDEAVFLALAIATIPAVVLWAPIAGKRRAGAVISGSRSNRVLLAALFGATFFGSALFINQAVISQEVHGISALASSIGFSLNALGGLVGARLSRYHRYPGWFMMSIGPAALLTVVGPMPLFYVGMAWWGFGFWMSIPGILQMLVDRSLDPSERAGDGQGVLALGRAAGPVLGGGFVDNGAYTGLAVTTCIGVVVSGLTVVGVKEGRDRLPPTDPRTIDQRSDGGPPTM